MQPALIATDRGVFDPSTGACVALEDQRVDDLAAGGRWAVVDGQELWHADDGTQLQRVATLTGPAATCVLPLEAGALVGSEDARLWSWNGHALERVPAFDHAESRSSWYTPWGGPPAVRSLATADDGTLYVNVHVGGILRSDDGGATWAPTIDVDADVHEVATVSRRPATVVAATARGLAVSHDHGQTWTVSDAGLHATYCRAVAVTGETVYLSASTGPSSTSAAVYRGGLDGRALTRCTAGLPEWFSANVDTRGLAARDDVALVGAPDGEVYVSTDEGATWSRLQAGLPPIRAVALL